MFEKKLIARRDFLRNSAFAAGAIVLAACKPAAAPTAVPEAPAKVEATKAPEAAPVERKDVEVWTGWTEDAAKNIEAILDGYNKSQERVTAKHVVIPENMTQRLLAGISAGTPPGTAVVFGASVAYQLAAQDGLLALDEVGKPEQIDALKKWMLPAIWDLGTYEGKFYYASMWNQCYGMFMNIKICEEKGVDPNKPAQNWEEMDEVWEKLTTYNADGSIDVLGGDVTWESIITARFLGQYVTEDGRTITANHENNLKALEWLTNRWKRIGPSNLQDYYASLSGRGERSAGLDPWLSGLRATNITGPWHFNTIKNFAPADFRYTVWPFPKPASADKVGMYTYGDGWIMPKGCPDVESSWEIIGTLTGATGDKDVYTSLFTTWQCVNGPVSKQMLDWPAFKDKVIGACPGYQEIFLKDLFESDYYLYPPKIPTSASYQSMMGSEWEKARLGEKTPKEALDFVQEQAQKELDDWIANVAK
jgi:ABC-type glycerol-3-phosphate transport system substrate-binding protein